SVSRIDAIGCNDLCHFVKQCNYVLTLLVMNYKMAFTCTLISQGMTAIRLEDPAQGEKSQWDAFAERNRDAAATKAMSQVAIERLITQRVNATLEAERASRANEGGKEATQMKQEAKIGHFQFVNMMLEEFCPDEEVQRMEDELKSLKLRDTNIAAYT
nr:hypothetical protein [Tanacetum cinerariifolium]